MSNSNESVQQVPSSSNKAKRGPKGGAAGNTHTEYQSSSTFQKQPSMAVHEESKGKNKLDNNIVQKQFSFQGQKLTNQLDEFERRNSKNSKKKGKKGIKRSKGDNQKELLGFDEFGALPFDVDRGYNLNELEYVHFTQKPTKRARAKSTNFTITDHVQANHRFILKPDRNQDYFFATHDPDYSVEWKDIFMVHAKRNTQYICPICRDENLIAPVISRCGHIFCWPCILHYLLYSSDNEGEDWRKCPL
jgi:hypothetical protein